MEKMKHALMKLGEMYLANWGKVHQVDPLNFSGSAEKYFRRFKIIQSLTVLAKVSTLGIFFGLLNSLIFKANANMWGTVAAASIFALIAVVIVLHVLHTKWFSAGYLSLKLYHMWSWKRKALKSFKGFSGIGKNLSEEQMRKVVIGQLQDLAVAYFHNTGKVARQSVFQAMIELREVAVDCGIHIPRARDFLDFKS